MKNNDQNPRIFDNNRPVIVTDIVYVNATGNILTEIPVVKNFIYFIIIRDYLKDLLRRSWNLSDSFRRGLPKRNKLLQLKTQLLLLFRYSF